MKKKSGLGLIGLSIAFVGVAAYFIIKGIKTKKESLGEPIKPKKRIGSIAIQDTEIIDVEGKPSTTDFPQAQSNDVLASSNVKKLSILDGYDFRKAKLYKF